LFALLTPTPNAQVLASTTLQEVNLHSVLDSPLAAPGLSTLGTADTGEAHGDLLLLPPEVTFPGDTAEAVIEDMVATTIAEATLTLTEREKNQRDTTLRTWTSPPTP
jgi:hypothetical protein